MAAPHTGNKPRGGVGGGNRRGSWRQSSGRASPAASQGSVGQGPRSARSGSQVDFPVDGSSGPVDSNPSVDSVPLEIVNKLQQHLGGRVLISVRGGARLQGTLSHMDNGNSPIAATTRFCLKDAVETQQNGSQDVAGQSGLVLPELYLRVGEVGSVEPGSGPSSITSYGKEEGKGGGEPPQAQAVLSNLAIVAPQNSLPSLFRTDKDIANGKGLPRQRELQPWVPDESIQPSSGGIPGKRDEDTFGNASAGWDQFATNAKLFGTKSDFDEDIYTTKLNKNTANFRQREAEAERLAREIQNAPSDNPHIAEERGREVASGMDEEDRYSGVQRSTNAYVPPGARKAGPGPTTGSSPLAVPSTNGAQAQSSTRDPTAVKSATPTPSSSTTIPVPSVSVRPPSVTGTPERGANLPQARKTEKAETPVIRHDVAGHIQAFVETERERVDKKKSTMATSMANVAKSERERKLQELKNFGKDFQVHLPFPAELLPILAKTPEKQREVQERHKAAQGKEASGGEGKSPATPLTSAKKLDSPQPLSKAEMVKQSRPQVAMQIREIPPFKPRDSILGAGALPASQNPPEIPPFKPKVTPVATSSAVESTKSRAEEPSHVADSPATSPPPRLNPGASSFVFKPNVSAPRFQPGGVPHPPSQVRQPEAGDTSRLQSPAVSSVTMAPSPSITSMVGPSPRPASNQPEIKPPEGTASFFPPSMPRRFTPINVRDDFNPFRGKVPDPKTVALSWPFSGKKLGSSSMPPGMGGPSPGHEDEPGMFSNGVAGMMSPMGGVGPSPMPLNFAYGPGPVRYPSQQGQPGQLQSINMPPGQASGYPPFVAPFMGGGPMYPQGIPPGFMNGPHPGQQNIPSGMRQGPGPPPMFYAAQSPASPHPGSPYAGQVAPPPT